MNHRSNSRELAAKVIGLWLMFCGPLSAEETNSAREILKNMSTEIAALESFVIVGDGYTDARLEAGQIIEHSTDVTLRVSKPATLRLTNRTAESSKEIFFGQGVLTVSSESEGFYAQHPLPVDLGAAVDFAVNEIGIDAPVLDLISNDVASYLTEDAESVDYLGLSMFRGKIYHHIGIRAPEVDVQLWVSKDEPTLPGKMSISSKWDAGSPRSVFFFDWNTTPTIEPGSLRFEPPANAMKIEFDLEATE
ncbi:MAG: DUF2092 domain-containing protein [Halioglobus sp.]